MGPTGHPEHAVPASPSLRVLCVDDNRDAADSSVELLELVGFTATACYDGESAVAGKFLPGVCIIDLNMPGMDGDELAFRLRADPRLPPMLLVSATAMADDLARTRIEAAGFDLSVTKPVDLFGLVAVVDAMVRVRGPRAAGRGE